MRAGLEARLVEALAGMVPVWRRPDRPFGEWDRHPCPKVRSVTPAAVTHGLLRRRSKLAGGTDVPPVFLAKVIDTALTSTWALLFATFEPYSQYWY